MNIKFNANFCIISHPHVDVDQFVYLCFERSCGGVYGRSIFLGPNRKAAAAKPTIVIESKRIGIFRLPKSLFSTIVRGSLLFSSSDIVSVRVFMLLN